jgi:hypothetical protein
MRAVTESCGEIAWGDKRAVRGWAPTAAQYYPSCLLRSTAVLAAGHDACEIPLRALIAARSSPRFGRLALATSLIIACSCADNTPFGTPASGRDLTGLSVAPETSFADGASIVRISASIPATSLANPRQITFVTDGGTFIGQPTDTAFVAVDTSGAASVLLRAPSQVMTAIVQASAGQTVLSDSIPFGQAFATTIALGASQTTVSDTSGMPITITAVIRRAVGVVSAGTAVSFATTAGQLGIPSLSDTLGQSNVGYTAFGVPVGPVTITATVTGMDSTSISTTTTLQVVP